MPFAKEVPFMDISCASRLVDKDVGADMDAQFHNYKS